MSEENNIKWIDAATLTVEGKGWTDTESFFDRLPARAKETVNADVWSLANNSAGIMVRFNTDSPEIHAQWKLTSEQIALSHMPATGVSGVDLYVRHQGKMRRLSAGCYPAGVENEFTLISGLTREMREYALYLPLYNGVKSLEVGITDCSTIKAWNGKSDIRPVVFYGSSIVQGGCCSRPGAAYPSIIGRKLEIPTINLGFSGSGKCENEVADLLAELDPSIFVIDCIPNMDASYVGERLRYLLDKLNSAHPETHIILIEAAHLQHTFIGSTDPFNMAAKNSILRSIFNECETTWGGRLHYIEAQSLLGDDSEPTVDGIHPTDLGFRRMADAITPVIEGVLNAR